MNQNEKGAPPRAAARALSHSASNVLTATRLGRSFVFAFSASRGDAHGAARGGQGDGAHELALRDARPAGRDADQRLVSTAQAAHTASSIVLGIFRAHTVLIGSLVLASSAGSARGRRSSARGAPSAPGVWRKTYRTMTCPAARTGHALRRRDPRVQECRRVIRVSKRVRLEYMYCMQRVTGSETRCREFQDEMPGRLNCPVGTFGRVADQGQPAGRGILIIIVGYHRVA